MKGSWLFNRKLDLATLFVPVWLCWFIAFSLPTDMLEADIPIWVWVVVVLGIDVSHVWSSIHRTYLDKEEFANHRKLLIGAPILSFVLSFGVAALSVDLFWRCLAYVAVYHFVKQQYGFMRIYKAKSQDFRGKSISDNFIIYLSMLYPIFYWHMHPNLDFAWFVHGDFLVLKVSETLRTMVAVVGNISYIGLLLWWLGEEVVHSSRRNEKMPIGKILWVLTTAGNWFLGIVYFNSDLVFTITNVVAHGVPYLALIVFYQVKKETIKSPNSHRAAGRVALVILSSVLFLAFAEEYLWDLMVYRENESLFGRLISYPSQIPSFFWQLVAIGVLAVPQMTHYILDGFIWKNNAKNPYLKKVLFE